MKEIRDVHVVQNSYAGSYVASVTLSNGSNLHISNIPDLFPIVDQITLQIEVSEYELREQPSQTKTLSKGV